MILRFKFSKNRLLEGILFIVVLFSLNPVYGQGEYGIVSGVVKDSVGKPLEHCVVSLKNANISSITKGDGTFRLNEVPAGNDVLMIQKHGFKTHERNIQIVANTDNVVQDLALYEDIHQLEIIDIVGGPRNKFAQKESEQIARMPLKNLENPQVYNVVGKELMKEQVVIERSDLYRNVPGGVPNFSAGGSQGIFMRGFSSTNGMRNGMITSAVFPLNPVILERVEFLRGPSGTLFGSNRNTSFGGVYNYVTKKPYETFGGEISLTAGSFDLSRVTADINTPLNEKKNVLVRLNTAWQSEGSFQDQGYAKNYTIAPSFSYQVNDRLKFVLDADFTRGNYTTYSIAVGTLSKYKTRNFKDMKLDYKRTYINNSVNVENGVNNVQALMEYKLSDKWKSQTNFLFSEGYYKDFMWTTLTLISDSTFSRSVRNQTPETFGNIQVQQNFVGDFNIGKFRNRVVVGVDLSKNYNMLNRATVLYDTVNVNKPGKGYTADKINELSAKNGFTTTTFKSETYGVYVSDVFNFTPALMAMVSLRLDKYSTKGNYDLNKYEYTGGYEQVSLSPKLGLVYQPLKERISLFANYMNGFVNLGPIPQPNQPALDAKPQYANQWEGGVKLDVVKGKLSAGVSYYDISVTNSTYSKIVVIDKQNVNMTFQDGTQRSKGFELELIATPVKGLNIIAGFAQNENKYTKASEALNGKYVVASPRQAANLWMSYSISKGSLDGFGIGVGGNYVSESWFEVSNSFVLPSYTLLDASVFYDKYRYRIAIKGNNLLDEHYWNSTGMPQKPRNFLASFAYKF